MDDEGGYVPRRGQVGSKWFNEEPSGATVAKWFASTVKLHDGLKHKDFVAGITLIRQVDEIDTVVAYKANGEPTITKITEISFTPYPRVEARIAYFWAYLALHPEWSGAIEPGDIGDPRAELPEGYFLLKVGEVELIGRAMQTHIRDRHGHDIHYYPPEAKTVPLVNRWGGVDADAMAKASTGAIGRALGVAGMLVLPGTGVATAGFARLSCRSQAAPGGPGGGLRGALSRADARGGRRASQCRDDARRPRRRAHEPQGYRPGGRPERLVGTAPLPRGREAHPRAGPDRADEGAEALRGGGAGMTKVKLWLLVRAFELRQWMRLPRWRRRRIKAGKP